MPSTISTMPAHRFFPLLEESLSYSLLVQRSKTSTLSMHEDSSTFMTSSSPSIFERLPVELQIEIFAQCATVFPQLSKHAYPSLFREVCKGWKELVISTPRLWSSFEIVIGGSPADTYEYDMVTKAALDIWLKRSRTYPLSFKIVHNPYTSGNLHDLRSAHILQMLLPHMDRWKHVHIVVPSLCFATIQFSAPIRFPNLLSLTLQTSGGRDSETPLDIHGLGIPWSQLTSLDLQPDYHHLLNLDDLLWILSEAVNLRSCTLGADCTLSAEAKMIDRIHIPALEELKLVFQGGLHSGNGDRPEEHMMDFLALLALPSVRSLQIEWLVQWNGGSDSWAPVQQSQFVSFLRGIENTVESLGLLYLPLGKYDILQCIATVPNVKRLDVRSSFIEERNDPITNAFFRDLTANSSHLDSRTSNASLPALRELSLMCNGGSFNPDVFLAMIRSRRESGGQLKQVSLVTKVPLPDVVHERLDLFKAAGLDITIDTFSIG